MTAARVLQLYQSTKHVSSDLFVLAVYWISKYLM